MCRVFHVLVCLGIICWGFFLIKSSNLIFKTPGHTESDISLSKFLSGWSASAQTIWACLSSYLALGHQHYMLLSKKRALATGHFPHRYKLTEKMLIEFLNSYLLYLLWKALLILALLQNKHCIRNRFVIPLPSHQHSFLPPKSCFSLIPHTTH